MKVFLLLFLIVEGDAFLSHASGRRDKSFEIFEKETLSYEETGSSSKGFVSGLTGIINFLFFKKENPPPLNLPPSPTSPTELMERIQNDYITRNYLWTGDIDLACFDENCKFTDPTISFESRDTFARNTKNLKVLIDILTEPGGTKSDLLDISVNSEYVESRWRMFGDLTGLPWKPRIDVTGRTKFWYRETDNVGLQVYEYDEAWEMPAGKALLQLITPARD